MSCLICDKYKNNLIQPMAELDGVALGHIAPSGDGLAMRGRLVIEPKRHVVNLEDLTPAEFANMGILLQKAMIVLKKSLGAEHVYFFRINDLVPHFHFHVLPRYPGTPKEFWGLKMADWPEYPKINLAEIQKISAAMRSEF